MVSEYNDVEHWMYMCDDGHEFTRRVQKVVDEAKKKFNNRNDFLVYCSFHLCIADTESFMRTYWEEKKGTLLINNSYNKKRGRDKRELI